MSTYQFAALILAGIGPILALARRTNAPASLVLFGLGLASSQVPGLPAVRVDPQLVLNLFLPPLLYASTVRVSWHLLRFTLVPGLLLGVLLVLTTIGAVASAAHFVLLPGLSWTGAFLLGVVTAIFDTRLFHEAKGRPHVPRGIADTLKSRELVGRLFILASFALAMETMRTGGLSAKAPLEHYVLDLGAGLLLGVGVGRAIAWARQRIDPAPVEIAVSVATPYAAALAATALGLSVVAAVTAAALVVSAVRINAETGGPISSSETRISATAFWEEVSILISSALFFLAGHALPEAFATLRDWPLWRLATSTLVLLCLVVVVQYAFGYIATGLRPISQALAARSGSLLPLRAAAAGVMAWSSTRSVIGLVIAFSIPAASPDGSPFPERDLILVVAASTIVCSVLVQGLTVRRVAARALLLDEDDQNQEIDEARRAMDTSFRSPGREHANGIDAARQALLGLRERNRIGDEVLLRMLRELDLTSRAAEGDALPGAGPPNP